MDKTSLIRFDDQKNSKRCLKLVGSHAMKEILSFLHKDEFLELCTSCKEFLKFLSNDFVDFQFNLPNVLFKENSFILKPILE